MPCQRYNIDLYDCNYFKTGTPGKRGEHITPWTSYILCITFPGIPISFKTMGKLYIPCTRYTYNHYTNLLMDPFWWCYLHFSVIIPLCFIVCLMRFLYMPQSMRCLHFCFSANGFMLAVLIIIPVIFGISRIWLSWFC